MQYRPLLTDIERTQQQGAAAGLSEEAIYEHILSEMSRTKRGTWFGTDSLEDYAWMGYSDRQFAMDQNSAWNIRAEFTYAYFMETGRQPSQELVNLAVQQVLLNVEDQENLVAAGLLSGRRPSIPNRENIQSDAERAQDSFWQQEAVLLGAQGTRWEGEIPEPDPREDQVWFSSE
jgi:hypothetical protein